MGHLNFDVLVFKHFMCQWLKLFPSNMVARTSASIHIPPESGLNFWHVRCCEIADLSERPQPFFLLPWMNLAVKLMTERRAERKGNMREIRKSQRKKPDHFIYADEPVRMLKPKKKSTRKCKICGKDPSPNYFYCPSCHHRVSHHSVEMEEERDEFGISECQNSSSY